MTMNEKSFFTQKLALVTGTENAAGYDGEIGSRREPDSSRTSIWSAVGSMALCVALLIAAEFMPVSLLTPIADDLGATVGRRSQSPVCSR